MDNEKGRDRERERDFHIESSDMRVARHYEIARFMHEIFDSHASLKRANSTSLFSFARESSKGRSFWLAPYYA